MAEPTARLRAADRVSFGRSRVTPRAVATFGGLLFALGIALVGPASAQRNPHPSTSASQIPALRAGTATIRGAVIDPANPGATSGLTVAVYALYPDGSPGLARDNTEADGSFRFGGLDGDPSIVYLIGVRYRDVPYGERVTFGPGQTEIALELPVTVPTRNVRDLQTLTSTLEIEWVGSGLQITEQHFVSNPDLRAIFVPADERTGATAPFEAYLPARAEGFESALFNGPESFDHRGDRLFYWGPIYPGEQQIRYSYRLPLSAGEQVLSLETRFPAGSGDVRVLVPLHGPEIASLALEPAEPIDLDGRQYRQWTGGPVQPGARIAMTVSLPETNRDLGSLHLAPNQLVVEIDDTVLEITQQHRLTVDPGARLAGTPEEPLIRFALPLDAELVQISAGARDLGIVPSAIGVDVIGPLGPGEHALSFRYRIPAPGGRATLSLRFPLALPALEVRIADTGVSIDSERLHRLRPERTGTRSWLRREAFQIEAGEVIKIDFAILDRTPLPRSISLSVMLTIGAGALLFAVLPLRQTGRETAGTLESEAVIMERELVYAMIRDVEHDFETGKLEREDYEQGREELRQRAIDLMRAERAAPVQPAAAAVPGVAAHTAEAGVSAGPESRSVSTAPAEPTTRAFCPSCGERVAPSWTFCSHCGDALNPALRGGAADREENG